MLNEVSVQINKASRNVVLNHPNRLEGQLIRKRVTRVSDGNLMGLPTMGGMGVLTSEDESEVEYDPIGNIYALRAEAYQSSPMMDRLDENNLTGSTFYFLVQPEILLPEVGGFEVKKYDVFYLSGGIGGVSVKLAYEIVGIETVGNIAPYTLRYVCNHRSDLFIVE